MKRKKGKKKKKQSSRASTLSPLYLNLPSICCDPLLDVWTVLRESLWGAIAGALVQLVWRCEVLRYMTTCIYSCKHVLQLSNKKSWLLLFLLILLAWTRAIAFKSFFSCLSNFSTLALWFFNFKVLDFLFVSIVAYLGEPVKNGELRARVLVICWLHCYAVVTNRTERDAVGKSFDQFDDMVHVKEFIHKRELITWNVLKIEMKNFFLIYFLIVSISTCRGLSSYDFFGLVFLFCFCRKMCLLVTRKKLLSGR